MHYVFGVNIPSEEVSDPRQDGRLILLDLYRAGHEHAGRLDAGIGSRTALALPRDWSPELGQERRWPCDAIGCRRSRAVSRIAKGR